MAETYRYHEKLFLCSQVSSTTDTDVNYWVLQITPGFAKCWLDAMDLAGKLKDNEQLLMVGSSVYGIEVFCPSRWVCEPGDPDNCIPSDVLDNARVAVLPGTPEDWGLFPSDERFDCETAIICDDGVTFRAALKYASTPAMIESDYIMRAAFEMAARGEVDEELPNADQKVD